MKRNLLCDETKFDDKLNNCDDLRNAVKSDGCVRWYENTFECEYFL